jgi:hypothetical protein
MEAVRSSKMLVPTYKSKQYYNPIIRPTPMSSLLWQLQIWFVNCYIQLKIYSYRCNILPNYYTYLTVSASVDCGQLGCDAAQSCVYLQMFQKNVLLKS